MASHDLFCSSLKEGIFRLAAQKVATQCASEPSFFLARHPHLPLLYSLNQSEAKVLVYSTIGEKLLKIGEVKTRALVPAHLDVDPLGRYLVVAGYGAGVEIFPLNCNDVPQVSSDFFLVEGRGLHPRQDRSHPHGIGIHDGLVYLADLGIDRVLAFAIDEEFRFAARPENDLVLAAGSGPRHVIFHSREAHAIVLNELGNTLSAFAKRERSGPFELSDTVSTLPSAFADESWAAEAAYHPNLPLCYASNRGHDSIGVFAINWTTGGLTPRLISPSGGKRPQHFLIPPDGGSISIAHAGSASVTTGHLDPKSGLPGGEIMSWRVPEPMCLIEVGQS